MSHLGRAEGRLVRVQHRELEGDGSGEALLGDPRQLDVPGVQRIEGAGEHPAWDRRVGRALPVGIDRDALDESPEQPVDRIPQGLLRRHRGDRQPIARPEESFYVRGGDVAGSRQGEEDRPRHQVFLCPAVAPALLEYDRDDVDALGVRDRDVAPMVALLRAVAHQARRDADAHESRLVGSSTAPGERPARHRDRGLGAAGLLGLPAEKLDQRSAPVGDDRLEQHPRPARHAEERRDRAAASSRDRQHAASARGMNPLDDPMQGGLHARTV